MGASTVTGTGQGSVDSHKGPRNLRSVGSPLICPRVLAAGAGVIIDTSVTLSAPPNVDLDSTHYNVFANAELGNITITKSDVGGVFYSFTLTSDAQTLDRADWTVTTIGIGETNTRRI